MSDLFLDVRLDDPLLASISIRRQLFDPSVPENIRRLRTTALQDFREVVEELVIYGSHQ